MKRFQKTWQTQLPFISMATVPTRATSSLTRQPSNCSPSSCSGPSHPFSSPPQIIGFSHSYDKIQTPHPAFKVLQNSAPAFVSHRGLYRSCVPGSSTLAFSHPLIILKELQPQGLCTCYFPPLQCSSMARTISSFIRTSAQTPTPQRALLWSPSQSPSQLTLVSLQHNH